MSDVLVIDGNSLINRTFYALPLLKNSKGVYTNAVYGFMNILFKCLEEEAPKYVAIAFDLKKPTFRHKEFTEYKAGRKGMPDELAEQMPILKDVLKLMNIKILEKETYEADDILGVISKQADMENLTTTILTGDRDSLQLISDKTTVKIPTNKGNKAIVNVFNLSEFRNVYGIEPQEFIDVKALMGDKSDNIPGVPAVGEKTALKLIKEYKNLDNLYDNIDSANVTARIKNNLIEYKEQAYLSRRLAEIVRDFDGISLNDCHYEGFTKVIVYEKFRELEFNSLLNKLNDDTNDESNEGKGTEQTVKVEVIKEIKENEIMNLGKSELLSYMIVYYKNEPDYMLLNKDSKIYKLDFKEHMEIIKNICEDITLPKIGYDIKKDIVELNKKGIKLRNGKFDILIAAYILNASITNYDMSYLVQKYLDKIIPSVKEVGNDASELEKLNALYISKFDDLYIKMKEAIIGNQQEHLFYNIEMELMETLADMEIEGFKVDLDYIETFGQKLSADIAEIENKIYEFSEEKFNINSPKQLGPILFEKLGLPAKKKTKTGYSTNIEVLNDLKGKHPIIECIIKYRQLAKLRSTYVDGLKDAACKEDSKIHSTFNQTIVTTGRISSTEPNLQNIPIKLEQGKLIRRGFIPSDDMHVLVDADYSQIELRVLAHLSKDENLIEAFKNNDDIHAMTAAKIFNVPLDQVTTFMRSSAKAVNFGIVYGISDFGLSRDLSISVKEAKGYIDSYFEKYPKIKEYMDGTIEFAKAKGYVETIFNRRRYIDEINSKNFMRRSAANRIAMNTPVQGSAADIIKIAMVNVRKKLIEQGLKSKLILQVHDELIIDTVKSELAQVKELLKNEMENAVELAVPLIADIKEGVNWYESK